MAARRVLVTIGHGEDAALPCADGQVAPVARGVEGMRAAVGLTRALHGHKVSILLCEDGVDWALMKPRKADVDAMLGQLRVCLVPCYVSADSLKEHSIDTEQVHESVQVVDRERLQKVLQETEVHLRY